MGLEISDKHLVERFQQGDQQAFEQIIERYEQKVWQLAMRLTGDQQDAYDLSQEAFLKVYRYLTQFRGQSNFSTWLYRVVTNSFYDEMRKRKRRPQVAVSLDSTITTKDGELTRELPSFAAGPEDLALQCELQQTVRTALARLPEEYRVVLVLRDLEDHSYEEIASILRLNLGTVKSRISRARLALRKLLLREEQMDSIGRPSDQKGG
jgi:RNA polymerase sigma-70 factor (ECF subfamily)